MDDKQEGLTSTQFQFLLDLPPHPTSPPGRDEKIKEEGPYPLERDEVRIHPNIGFKQEGLPSTQFEFLLDLPPHPTAPPGRDEKIKEEGTYPLERDEVRIHPNIGSKQEGQPSTQFEFLLDLPPHPTAPPGRDEKIKEEGPYPLERDEVKI
ncbi:hypothetical protein O181_123848 [Austropuccinia psidii MF-1]|uniref:Uncharacterized protein n=1 Tax=Austropuccinia psidii MF-1 TaxID=1389203 RepID=A0A9Q3Q3J0_9BASI|nr:hypothetical protein [Austropuccinia psidii MF-1]